MRRVISCLGDSQTDWSSKLGIQPDRIWPHRLALLLRAEALNARVRGFGISGDTTTLGLARANDLLLYETPDVAVVYLGVNDPGATIAQATTQNNVEGIVQALKHGATGAGAAAGSAVSVATPSALPANGQLGQRYVVLNDNSTTGGVAAWHASQATTITGTQAGVTVWEYRYGLVGELGWGRVATAATAPVACKRIVVVSTNYKNYTTGGDTLATPETTYATVRTALQAAVTAQNVTVGGAASVVYADLYAFQRARIVAGTDPDFSSVAYDQTRSWHVANQNQHHNEYGHELVAQVVRAAFPAAWMTALAA